MKELSIYSAFFRIVTYFANFKQTSSCDVIDYIFGLVEENFDDKTSALEGKLKEVL